MKIFKSNSIYSVTSLIILSLYLPQFIYFIFKIIKNNFENNSSDYYYLLFVIIFIISSLIRVNEITFDCKIIEIKKYFNPFFNSKSYNINDLELITLELEPPYINFFYKNKTNQSVSIPGHYEYKLKELSKRLNNNGVECLCVWLL